MKNLSTVVKSTIIIAILLVAPKLSFALCYPHQSWCNYCCYCNKACNCGYSQSSTPIDGGLSLLLVAGVAYGGKRYAKMKKEQKSK
jgi:hypothetical protein